MVNTIRGQVSLEYLMTYGIAIAIVVIAIAALYSMGVFSPSSSTVACSPCFSNFAFVDYSDGTLVLKNGPKNLENVNCTWSTGFDYKGNVNANEQFNITGIPHDSSDDLVKLNLTYANAISHLPHTDTATIHN